MKCWQGALVQTMRYAGGRGTLENIFLDLQALHGLSLQKQMYLQLLLLSSQSNNQKLSLGKLCRSHFDPILLTGQSPFPPQSVNLSYIKLTLSPKVLLLELLDLLIFLSIGDDLFKLNSYYN